MDREFLVSKTKQKKKQSLFATLIHRFACRVEMAGMFGASSDAAFLAALGTQSQQPTTTTTEPSQQPRRGSKIVPSLPIATMPAQPEEGTGTPPPPPAGTAPPPLPPPLVAPSPAKTLGLVAAIASDPVFAVGDRVAVPQHGEGAQ